MNSKATEVNSADIAFTGMNADTYRHAETHHPSPTSAFVGNSCHNGCASVQGTVDRTFASDLNARVANRAELAY
jgi:hypothetical protein